jgi:transposase
MSKGRPREIQKERFWRDALNQWRPSRLSVRAYCQQQGLSQGAFRYWQRTLAARDRASASFSAVHVVPDPKPEVLVSGGAFELVLNNHRVLRIEPGFDASTLRRLLAVLEEDSAC